MEFEKKKFGINNTLDATEIARIVAQRMMMLQGIIMNPKVTDQN